VPTELVWDGKYKDGKKSSPLRISLPFQDVETVNESTQERQKMLDLFSSGRPADWRNRLIWGDKKYVLPSLLPEFAGKIKLIYIDPPFATGDNFTYTVTIPNDMDDSDSPDVSFTKEPSVIEQKAYRDTWGRGLDSYLQWFYETAFLLYELLAADGSIYVHCDGRVNSYVRLILNDVFGPNMYRSEISWKRTNAHGNADYKYGAITDYILFYAKSGEAKLNPIFQSYSPEELSDAFPYVEEKTGRRYASQNMTNYNKDRPNLNYVWKGHRRTWLFSIDKMRELDEAGKIVYSAKTGFPRLKQYADESLGKPIGDIWTDIPALKHAGHEVLGYATQKPEALLKRIVTASSNDDDLVLDCFCGSGTTAAVAEKIGRRWIVCDLGRFAIHTTRKRLLGVQGVKPFVVQNLGKYERQLWQADEFGPQAAQRIAAYTNFILDLYHAQPLSGRVWLHGIKGNRVVHVGSIDSPVTLADVKSIIIEWQRNVGKSEVRTTGIDALGWDFAFELNEVARQQALDAGVDLKFYTIPREVLEKKAVEQGDIQFFELAALFVETHIAGRTLTLTLTNFVPPLDYVPQDIRSKITNWESWIDYWAVDFEFKGDTFHNEWQSYRTKASNAIAHKVTNTYNGPGTYCVNVKVIDIFGNDTTRTLQIEIA